MNYGRIPQDTVNKIVKNWYSDRTELFKLSEEAKSNKIFDKLFTIIQKEEKKIPISEFEALFLANDQKKHNVSPRRIKKYAKTPGHEFHAPGKNTWPHRCPTFTPSHHKSLKKDKWT